MNTKMYWFDIDDAPAMPRESRCFGKVYNGVELIACEFFKYKAQAVRWAKNVLKSLP